MDRATTKLQSNLVKLFHGRYRFYHKQQVYAGESFEVWQNPQDKTLTFRSEIFTPNVKGEDLKITTCYIVDQNYRPIQLVMERCLGEFYAQEVFTPDKELPRLNYIFKTQKSHKEITMQVPPLYHLATSAICTAFFFSKTKKYDPIALNNFHVITSHNIWEYQGPPQIGEIFLKCENILTEEERSVGNKKLMGTQFVVSLGKEQGKKQGISYFISRYHAIPYQVTVDHRMQIEIDHFHQSGGDDLVKATTQSRPALGDC